MSKKHFDEYYDGICKQYFELLNDLKDIQQYATENVVAPEIIKAMETTLEPIKNNYEMVTYIKYLLNMPEKKSKQPRYNNTNKKICENNPARLDKQLEVGDKVLQRMKELPHEEISD